MNEDDNKPEIDGAEEPKVTGTSKAKSTASMVGEKAKAAKDAVVGGLTTAFNKATDNKPGKFIRALFNFAAAVTKPARWAAVKAVKYGVIEPTKLWAKTSVWGATRESNFLKATVPLTATALLGAWFTATQYSVLYSAVALGDQYWFGDAYSSGERTGTITKLSMKGKFPCNSMEGELSMPNIGKDGSSTFPFSIRRLGLEEQEAALAAYENGDTVSLAYDQSHWPTEWFDSENEGWFVPFLGLTDFECVQKTDYNITEVKVRPGRVLSEPPRLTPGQ